MPHTYEQCDVCGAARVCVHLCEPCSRKLEIVDKFSRRCGICAVRPASGDNVKRRNTSIAGQVCRRCIHKASDSGRTYPNGTDLTGFVKEMSNKYGIYECRGAISVPSTAPPMDRESLTICIAYRKEVISLLLSLRGAGELRPGVVGVPRKTPKGFVRESDVGALVEQKVREALERMTAPAPKKERNL